MKLWKWSLPRSSGGHTVSPEGRPWVQFSGRPPSNPAEELIQQVAAAQPAVPLAWLEDRLAEVLYRQELRQGAAALDIGIWGPGLFREEAARLVASMSADFGALLDRSPAAAPSHPTHHRPELVQVTP